MKIDVFSFNTIVVGSGAAGLNAADRLYDFGQHDIAIVAEGMDMGTSRNAGSDKQTYYKLTLAGGEPDSVLDMARTLFDGGCMHGDLALCEAALSVKCFNKLTDIGVPFPHNRYGEYVGYKTDHDPRQRATSAGPLTSRFMTEKLEAQVKAKDIRIFDGYKVIGIITDNGVCKGLIALNKARLQQSPQLLQSLRLLQNQSTQQKQQTHLPNFPELDDLFVLFNCTNVILATGGPAGLYSCSVYPTSQTGSNGMAFEAGAAGRNLTEWQYGLASTKFCWNLSGSYQQVIPRYVSTDIHGNDAQEFLDPYFDDDRQMLTAIFLKGYQWPFDTRKIANGGSSLIDILVHQEIHKNGRRVFLDFLHNPATLSHDFSNLVKEAFTYLERSGALQATPIERLAHLNRPAIDLYRNNGIDLTSEMLEIAVSAQHNNGGIAVNDWWETDVPHLFAVGEAAGTHGVYRPGGSSLNSGQVGGTRAAMYIARRYTDPPIKQDDFIRFAHSQVAPKIALAQQFINNKTGLSPQATRSVLGDRMSAYAAHIRRIEEIRHVKEEASSQLQQIATQTVISDITDLTPAFENVDLLIAQYVYAAAMEDYIAAGGGSRGSYIIPAAGEASDADIFNFTLDNGRFSSKIQEIRYNPQGCVIRWDDVRPIPRDDDWFENVWREYREDGIIR